MQGAFAAFREAIKREPRNASAHNNLGVLYEKRGQMANAVQEYRLAVSLDKSFVDARANLARFGNLPVSAKAAGPKVRPAAKTTAKRDAATIKKSEGEHRPEEAVDHAETGGIEKVTLASRWTPYQ